MPQFKNTTHIEKARGEIFDENWMDSDVPIFPKKEQWDYSRELKIEDVNVWQVIIEMSDSAALTGGVVGLYAAWDPYAEFYLVRHAGTLEPFYGHQAEKRAVARMKELGVMLKTTPVWVEPEDMWMYQPEEPSTVVID